MPAASLLHSLKQPDKLRTLGIMALNGMFDEMDSAGVLKQALTELLPGDVAIVSSFGADSAVLLHMVSEINPDLPVYFLETGKHFPETLAYVETLKRQLGLTNVISLLPDPADLDRFDPKGNLWETDPDSAAISARPSHWSRSSRNMPAGHRAEALPDGGARRAAAFRADQRRPHQGQPAGLLG